MEQEKKSFYTHSQQTDTLTTNLTREPCMNENDTSYLVTQRKNDTVLCKRARDCDIQEAHFKFKYKDSETWESVAWLGKSRFVLSRLKHNKSGYKYTVDP